MKKDLMKIEKLVTMLENRIKLNYERLENFNEYSNSENMNDGVTSLLKTNLHISIIENEGTLQIIKEILND